MKKQQEMSAYEFAQMNKFVHRLYQQYGQGLEQEECQSIAWLEYIKIRKELGEFYNRELLFLKLCYNKLLKPELLGMHLGRELRRAGVNMIRLPFLYLTESFSKGIGREKERHQEIHIEMEKVVF